MYRIKPISPCTVQKLSLRPCRTYFFLAFTGQVTVHGGFLQLRGFWGTYLTGQNTRGLHISSLSVKCASCHGTRTKCSPTFFFQCLVMEDPLHVATKTSEEVCSQIVMIPVLFFFLFFFFNALDPFRLGVILQVIMRSINPTIIRPVPAGLSLKLCRRCRKAALAPFWTPVFLRNPATPTELGSLFFFFPSSFSLLSGSFETR